jgi:arginine-tRNA-protein transferase
MKSIARFIGLPTICHYLPDRVAQAEYERVGQLTPSEYEGHMLAGWRRFGHTLFRPVCPACQACLSLRVDVTAFRPNRSQRRCRKLNENTVRLEIDRPHIDSARLELYDRYHHFQTEAKDWPPRDTTDVFEYVDSFVDNPFPTDEYTYWLDDRLLMVSFVDRLPTSLSAIYCFYDPAERWRSLGTWNVLSVIEQAAQQGRPWIYLGYYVEGCRSLEYKARFVPNQIRQPDGQWIPFRS